MPAGGETNWAAVGYTLVATILGAFVALWAQGAPVNRGMRSALYVTIGFVASLLLLVALVTWVATGAIPWAPIVLGLGVFLPLWRPFRQMMARMTRLDPNSPTHTVALIGVIVTLLYSAALFLASASGQALPTQGTSAVELLAQYLALAVLSFFAVGLWLRRDWKTVLLRLGLTRPHVGGVGLALLLALAVQALTVLLRLLAPTAPPADRTSEALTALLPDVAGALVVALSTAAGLEILFRGALQPRLGLPLTALTFVAVHAAYPPALPLLSLVGLAVGLGPLRRRSNTTACIIAHAAYNILLLAWLIVMRSA